MFYVPFYLLLSLSYHATTAEWGLCHWLRSEPASVRVGRLFKGFSLTALLFDCLGVHSKVKIFFFPMKCVLTTSQRYSPLKSLRVPWTLTNQVSNPDLNQTGPLKYQSRLRSLKQYTRQNRGVDVYFQVFGEYTLSQHVLQRLDLSPRLVAFHFCTAVCFLCPCLACKRGNIILQCVHSIRFVLKNLSMESSHCCSVFRAHKLFLHWFSMAVTCNDVMRI